ASGGNKRKETEVSQRYYLSDACFLVGLEGENTVLLNRVNNAIAAPRWQVYLGRKAFLPTWPIKVTNDCCQDTLLDALKSFPWQGHDSRDEGLERNIPDRLRIVLQVGPSESVEVRNDQPLSLAVGRRRFTLRYVKTDFVEMPKGG
ncbi:MAG: type I-E CRISPR-associated protein Cas5/CasD, partial [Nitrososphaera sp.]|nr:type I-E CRISPR-associated protein Cas5/CasD [Nitrososphaera sp.]